MSIDPTSPLVVLGGRSEIGLEVAVRLAPGRTVILAARNPDALDAETARLHSAGAAHVDTVAFDADDLATHAPLLDGIEEQHGAIGTAVLAFGILGDQARAEHDATHAAAIIHTDLVAQVSLLTLLADRMRARGAGEIVAFSSIAGNRVRRANYVYGAAKAGLDGFLAGLTDALAGTGVHVLTVRPGFVIGRMTRGMDPAPLSTTPGAVADATVKALWRGVGAVWVPRPLAVLAAAMRMTPRPIWRRLPR